MLFRSAPAFYANRRQKYDETLPWDHIDIGINKQFLIRENENSKQAKVTPNCRMNCAGCGISQVFTGGIC